MKVLVTGNLGYVGVGIVQVLLEHNIQVVGFDRLLPDQPLAQTGFEQIRGDITSILSVYAALGGCDAAVHAAIGTRVLLSDAQEYDLENGKLDYSYFLPFKINVSGTFNLFEICRQLGIKQVINISSAAVVFHHVIDRQDNHVHPYQLKADTSPDYRGYYGLNKYLQEQIGEYFAREYSMSVITFRPWWVVDGITYQNRMGVDLKYDAHPLTPAGLVCRYDLGEAVCLALQHPEINYDIFYPVTGPGSSNYFDTAHLAQRLEWQPRHTFEELAKTWIGSASKK